MTSTFTRRVSFNNLQPDYIESNDISPFKQNYSLSFQGNTPGNNGVSGNGYTSVNHFDVARLYSSTAVAQPPLGTSKRKCNRLPDPPSKSILKNSLSERQRSLNIEHSHTLGTNYHGDLNDMVDNPPTNGPKSEVGLPDLDVAVESSDSDDPDNEERAAPEPPKRHRSYSGMTDEELMALDPQYQTTKSKVSNVDMFKFDSQKTYYLPSARKSSVSGSGTGVGAAGKTGFIYPTSNENNYKSISLTVKHPGFDETGGNDGELHRCLLTVISGRRHSWNSLDWLFKSNPSNSNSPCKNSENPSTFLQDGDYLVVAASIPAKVIQSQLKKSKKRGSTGSIYNPDTDGFLYKKCENLLHYILENIPQDLKLKITVEFISDNTINFDSSGNLLSSNGSVNGGSISNGGSIGNGNGHGHTNGHINGHGSCHGNSPSGVLKRQPLVGTKFMLSKLVHQYQPYLVIVGNKSTSLNFKYPRRLHNTKHRGSSSSGGTSGSILKRNSLAPPTLIPPIHSQSQTLKDEYLIKLSSYLIKYLPVPVILVGNSTKQSKQKNPGVLRHDSTGSIESMDSDSTTTDQVDTAGKVIETVTPVDKTLGEKIEDLFSDANNINRFQNMISLISDSSLTESKAYLDQVRSQPTGSTGGSSSVPSISFDANSLANNSRIHSIYTSTKSGSGRGDSEPIYKVKSLLSYEEEPETKKPEKKLEKVKSNMSALSSASSSNKEEKSTKKKSFWKKIGLKGK
ncbi:hypothetical protein CAAN3_06S05424 [[Candida] anglica]